MKEKIAAAVVALGVAVGGVEARNNADSEVQDIPNTLILEAVESTEAKTESALQLTGEDFENPDLTVANPDSMPTPTYEQVVNKVDEFLDSLSEEMGPIDQKKENFISDLGKAGKFASFEEIIRSFSRLPKDDLATLNESYLLPYENKIASENKKKDFPEGYTTEKQVAINTLRWAGVYIWTSKEPPSFSELLKKIL